MDPNSPHFTILHRCDAGYVARCGCCQDIQVAIGNLVCHMDEESFLRFHHDLHGIGMSVDDHLAESPDGERLFIGTPVPNMMLSFSLVEYAQILDLFAQARLMLEVQAILQTKD